MDSRGNRFYHETHEPDRRKAKELILLVASLTADDPNFGSVKFNKVLCHAEFSMFFRTGKPITGLPYQKNTLGPTLEALLLLAEELEEQRRMDVKQPREHYEVRRYIALEEPDAKIFSQEELLAVVRAIKRVKDLSANEASDLSHEFPGWAHAEMFETIPYESVFWVERPLTEEEIAYGRKLDQADAAAATK
jgi:hypothetical protein